MTSLGGPLKRIKIDEVKGKGAKVKSYKAGAAGEPSFPNDFEIYDSVTLQVTDFQSNHNKYYALELHVAKVGKKETYRVRRTRERRMYGVDQSLTEKSLILFCFNSSILIMAELMTCIPILMLAKRRLVTTIV